jgi:hypothetical protein
MSGICAERCVVFLFLSHRARGYVTCAAPAPSQHPASVAVLCDRAKECALGLRLRVFVLPSRCRSRAPRCCDVGTPQPIPYDQRTQLCVFLGVFSRPLSCTPMTTGTGYQTRPLSGFSVHPEACPFLFGKIGVSLSLTRFSTSTQRPRGAMGNRGPVPPMARRASCVLDGRHDSDASCWGPLDGASNSRRLDSPRLLRSRFGESADLELLMCCHVTT